jgi:hypothetical protein
MSLLDSVFFLNAKILLLLRRGGLSLSLCTWFKTEHIFLETIRAVSITPAVARVPPKEIYDAILKGIQESKSVELTVASFQLLHDLDLVNFLHQSCPWLQPSILYHVVPICPQSSGPLSSCLGFSSLPCSNVCISDYKVVVQYSCV